MTLPGAPMPMACRVPGRWATEAIACRGSMLVSVTISSPSSTARKHVMPSSFAALVSSGLEVVRDACSERREAGSEDDAPSCVAHREAMVLERAEQPVRDRAMHAQPLREVVDRERLAGVRQDLEHADAA